MGQVRATCPVKMKGVDGIAEILRFGLIQQSDVLTGEGDH